MELDEVLGESIHVIHCGEVLEALDSLSISGAKCVDKVVYVDEGGLLQLVGACKNGHARCLPRTLAHRKVNGELLGAVNGL
jgi:hypothetical protein